MVWTTVTKGCWRTSECIRERMCAASQTSFTQSCTYPDTLFMTSLDSSKCHTLYLRVPSRSYFLRLKFYITIVICYSQIHATCLHINVYLRFLTYYLRMCIDILMYLLTTNRRRNEPATNPRVSSCAHYRQNTGIYLGKTYLGAATGQNTSAFDLSDMIATVSTCFLTHTLEHQKKRTRKVIGPQSCHAYNPRKPPHVHDDLLCLGL